MFARAGQQTGVLAKALRNRRPWDANLSRFGVWTSALPMHPRSCPRHWSGRISRTLGRQSRCDSAGAEAGEELGFVVRRAAAIRIRSKATTDLPGLIVSCLLGMFQPLG